MTALVGKSPILEHPYYLCSTQVDTYMLFSRGLSVCYAVQQDSKGKVSWKRVHSAQDFSVWRMDNDLSDYMGDVHEFNKLAFDIGTREGLDQSMFMDVPAFSPKDAPPEKVKYVKKSFLDKLKERFK